MMYPIFPILRKLILFTASCLLYKNGLSQYYYHDIVLTEQNRQQQQLYLKNAITLVKLVSYEANGQAADNFFCEVTPNSNYSKISTITQSDLTGNSLLTAYYHPNGQLFHSTDSSKEVLNQYQYQYDADGRLSAAINTSEGFTNTRQQVETHEWKYDQKGCPEKMLRIKNGTDTSVVHFTCDDNGRVTEENSLGYGNNGKIYYYYDSLHRLTDIVRFNPRLSKLLPDYMFEYNTRGELIQMTTVLQGGSDYLIWQYVYADNGLKTEARCFNKQKRLEGKIAYQYSSR